MELKKILESKQKTQNKKGVFFLEQSLLYKKPITEDDYSYIIVLIEWDKHHSPKLSSYRLFECEFEDFDKEYVLYKDGNPPQFCKK